MRKVERNFYIALIPLLLVSTGLTQPLHGLYDLGGGNNDFDNFSEAVLALMTEGVDGPVIFDVYGGDYNEAVILTEINGSGEVNTITFNDASGQAGLVYSGSEMDAVMTLDGGDYYVIDGIDITATDACDVSVFVFNDADNNSFTNLAITGRDNMTIAVRGVKIDFDSNDNLLFDNVTVSGCYYGIRNEGSSSYSQNLEVRYCTILDTRYGCYIDNANQVRIHHNDIQPGTDGANAHTYGVYISSLGGGNEIHVYNNHFHNIRNGHTSSFYTVAAVESHPSYNATAYIYNNFVYDFVVTAAKIHAFHIGSGDSYLYHNSVLLNDVGASSDITGFYMGTGSATLADNIFMLAETEATCYGIMRSGGAVLSSDYNCFYGSGNDFHTGLDDGSEYTTLAEWQTLGRDPNSLTGDPGYLTGQDLHIDSSIETVDSRGIAIPLVIVDIDGEARENPPDIGADEYEFYIGPEPVDDLSITVIGEDAHLNWSVAPGAATYRIYVSEHPTIDFTLLDETEETAYIHNDAISDGTTLFYRVTSND